MNSHSSIHIISVAQLYKEKFSYKIDIYCGVLAQINYEVVN